MRHLPKVLFFVLLASMVFAITACSRAVGTDAEEIARTGKAIRDAFAKSDVEGILRYHHPEVVKALSYKNVVYGRDALGENLRSAFQHNRIEFLESRDENLLIHGDTAVEQAVVTIKLTPLVGGQPTVVHDRALVVYVRYADSPTGWASMREVIQSGD
jgi:ketosteroid isomerase-like protein